MPVSLPPVTTSLGNQVIVFLTTPPASPTGIPTVAEVNAALFAGCHIYGSFAVTPTQNSGEGPRKLYTRTVPTQLGLVNYPAVELSYSYMPQDLGTPGAEGNEVYEALEPGAEVTTVLLNGVEGKTSAVVAGDIADIYLMANGVRRKGMSGDGEFDEMNVTQTMVVVGGEPVAEDHPLAAV